MKLLKITLVLNALSCIVFGLLFLLFSEEVSTFIGNSISWLIPVVGSVLIFNGVYLLFASKRSKPIFYEILFFVLGDASWVIGTLILVYSGIVITSESGIITSLSIALMVSIFGIMQVVGYRQIQMGE